MFWTVLFKNEYLGIIEILGLCPSNRLPVSYYVLNVSNVCKLIFITNTTK
jgi:hypothetical protein